MGLDHWALVQTSPPAAEPLTLDEAKLHLKVEHAADDQLIRDLVAAAREYAEQFTGRQIVTAAWSLFLDWFPDCEILLRRTPVRTVAFVKYYDVANVLQTLDPASYLADLASEPARLAPATGESWPATYARQKAVEVGFTAGYYAATAADTSGVPGGLKVAMKMHLAHFYFNRGATAAEMPKAIDDLLWKFWTGD